MPATVSGMCEPSSPLLRPADAGDARAKEQFVGLGYGVLTAGGKDHEHAPASHNGEGLWRGW
jgi:hypothetical protein